MELKNLSGSTRQRTRDSRLPNFIRRFWVAKLFIFALLFTNKLSAQTITVDGNPNDWDSVFAHNQFSTHIHDLVNSGSDDVWTGGSQNVDPISGWHWTASNTADKTDIGNAGIALIGHKIYVMADLFATNGDAAVGFWVLKQNIQKVVGGTFSGAHEVGDLLIGIAFSNGGATATTIISKWNGTGLDTINLSTSAANAATNTTTVSVPPDWNYVPKTGDSSIYPETSFFEAFVDLDSVNVTFDPCFSSFTVLTWNSQSIHASLADLTQGIFATKPQVTVANDTVCAGSAAVFTAMVTGGLSPFLYSWNGGAFLATNTFTVSPANANQMIRVTVQGSNGCLSEPDTAQLVVKPSPTIDSIPNFTYCNRDAGSAINFTSPTAGTTFAWTGTTNVGFGTSGTGSIGTYTATNSGTAALTTTVTVTPTAGGCPGTPRKFTVTVNPTPNVDSVGNATYCNGDVAAAINFTGGVGGTTFTWTGTANVGFGTSGTGSIGTYTATNSGTTALTSTVTVTPSANGCTGAARKFIITVKPTPKVDSVGNATYCNGATGAAINFTGPVSGTTFAWTGTADVGFGTSGTGSIGTYTATNSGSSPVTDVVTVTPSANSCTGAARTFTVTVNPTPHVDSIGNATYCNKDVAAAINFTGPVSGTTFTWSGTTDVGFGTSGTGSIGTYTATNSGATALTTTVTVTPSANGCSGPGRKFVITVNPTPNVDSIGNFVYCNGDAGSPINFSGGVSGTTFNWTATSDVGFGASGSTNIPAYTANNPGPSMITSTVTVTPTANGCPGAPRKFTVKVNPTAVADSVGNFSYCNGDAASAIDFSGAVGGTTFNWSSTADVGFGTSGSTDIDPYTATNTGTAIVTATVTVTPTATGCSGVSRKFTITVRPTPKVDSIGNAVYCKGALAAGINFNGPVSGTTFTWNGSANVGFGTSGTGSIGTYTATNGGSTPVVDVVTVTPTANGCTGLARTFTVTVNPNPGPNAPVANDLLCNGAVSAAIPLTSLDTSTHFTWLSDVDFGFGTTGTDSIPSFTGINGGVTPDTITIRVVGTSSAGCSGPDTTGFLIVVNPSPSPNAPITNKSVCQGTLIPSIIFSGLDPTVTYHWKASANVGAGLAGDDSIHAFIAIGAPLTATVTVTSTSANGCPGDSTGFTITVNPVPVVTARDTFTCVGVSVPLRGSPAGGTWTGPGVSGSSFSIGSVGTYTVVYHFTSGGCTDSARARVTVTNCGSTFGSYTQGYYGGKGKSCGGPGSAGKYNNPIALITYLLGADTMYIGRPGREVIIPPTAAAAAIVNAVMPGGHTPNKLTVAANVYISNTAGSVFATNYLTGGRINNVFLSQTIAIKFANRLSGLGAFPIEYSASGASRFETQQVTTSDCKTFTPVPCTGSSNFISQAVTKYLTHAGTVPATTNDLIALADDLLGGVRTPGETFGGFVVPTYAQVTDAEDALLHAFDEWKFFPGSYNTNVNAGCGGKPLPTAPLTGDFKVYPNPNTGSFNVEIPAITSDATIKVMDINGRVIATQTAAASENPQMLQFNLSVSQGMYFVHMISGDSEFATKVLIQ